MSVFTPFGTFKAKTGVIGRTYYLWVRHGDTGAVEAIHYSLSREFGNGDTHTYNSCAAPDLKGVAKLAWELANGSGMKQRLLPGTEWPEEDDTVLEPLFTEVLERDFGMHGQLN